MENRNRVVIAGAGITGLTIAFRLKQKGIPFLLLEALPAPGGKIGTLEKNGFHLDLGPATCARNQPLTELISDLGISSKVILPTRAFRKRYIDSKRKLHAIPPHPIHWLLTEILSFRSKLSIFKDLCVSPSLFQEDESVSNFVRRHFSEEVLQRLFDPIINGIYAGSPDRLSILSVMPWLKKLEGEHGSIIKGLWKNRKNLNLKREIISFRGGFKTLIEAMATEIGESLLFNARVNEIKADGESLKLSFSESGELKEMAIQQLILTLPAPDAGQVLCKIDSEIAETLNTITYNPIWQIYCSLESQGFTGFDGFGFLIPSAEKMTLLGGAHNSGLFPGRAPQGRELFTLFCKSNTEDEATIVRNVSSDFVSLFNLAVPPDTPEI